MLKKLSFKLFTISSLLVCTLAMAVMILYAQFIMGGQAAQYDHLLTDEINVPDLMFGYNTEKLLSFMLLLGPDKLKLYMNVVLIWDTIFPFVYTTMNVLLFSYVFRDLKDSRYFWINLLPILSIPLDLIENMFELMMVKEYLENWAVESWKVSGGSIAGMVKWSYTFILYVILALGTFRMILSKFNRSHA